LGDAQGGPGSQVGCRSVGRGNARRDAGRPGGFSDEIAEDDQKVIVRSKRTVGYVGKDIAYHMWKFGLLGKDFGYRKFHRYVSGQQCWISAIDGEPDHPHFGDVAEIYT